MSSLNKHKMLHKVLSFALALMLVVGLVPGYTYAADESKNEITVQSTDASGEAAEASDESTQPAKEAAAGQNTQPAADTQTTAGQDTQPAADKATAGQNTQPAADKTKKEQPATQAAAPTTTTTSDGNVADFAGAWKSSNFKPGTYTVTANISMPGQYNPVLKGVTVYANNPNNPFGPTLDPDDPAENVEGKAPTTPLENNATLTVKSDGTLELSLPIKNSIFTTQKIGTSANLAYTATRLVKEYKYGNNTVDGRIYKLDATLGKVDLTEANVASYTFKGSELYALPLNLTFKPDGDIALQLDVDLSTIPEKEKDENPDEIGDAPVAGTVTRTTQLDLCASKSKSSSCTSEMKSIDKMKEEGWRWERNENGDGGTLTLKNFYMKLDSLQYGGSGGAIFLGGNVKVVLEGTNVIEVNGPYAAAFLGSHGMAELSNLTITETKAGGSLEMRLGDGVSFGSDASVLPYGIAAGVLNIQSGTVKMNHVDLGNIAGSMYMTGGNLEISLDDRYADEYGVTVHGNVDISGGNITVNGGAAAIAQNNFYGYGVNDTTRYTVGVTGDANFKISNCKYGLYANNQINIDSTGSFYVDNVDTAFCVAYAKWNDGNLDGCISVQNLGENNLNEDKIHGLFLNNFAPNSSRYLNLRAADYTAYDEAMAKVPEDLTIYTSETAKNLQDAISQAKYRTGDKAACFLEQDTVDYHTEEILKAIDALVRAPEVRTYPTLKTDLSGWLVYTMPEENDGGTGIKFSVYSKTDENGVGIGIFNDKGNQWFPNTVEAMQVLAKPLDTEKLTVNTDAFDGQYAIRIGQKNFFGSYGVWNKRLGESGDISATAMVLEKKAKSKFSTFYLVADYGDYIRKEKLESAIDSDGNACVMVNLDLLKDIESSYYVKNLIAGMNNTYDGSASDVIPSTQPYVYIGETAEIPEADYTAVDEALKKVPEDMSIYGSESVKAVQDAVAAVKRDLKGDEQDKIDAMAKAIENAVNGLEKLVEKPVANENLIYNGKEQIGVEANDAYTLINETATKAGEHKAVAKLNKGYIWADESRDDVTVKYTIAKADPVAETPEATTGLMGQKLAEIALPEGFSWAEPETVLSTAGEQTFDVLYTPEDTDNYNTLTMSVTVEVYKTAAKPVANENLVYNGEEQTGVEANEAYTLTGAAATKAGEHEAVATLNPGYVWADGSRDDVTVKYTIAKADPVVNTPEATTGLMGQKLAEIALPEGFAWAEPETVLSTAGEQTFDVLYTPEDTDNYNTLTMSVTVNVYKIAVKPVANEKLVYNGKKQTGVNANDAYTLTGAAATKAGKYTATAKLNKGYIWADESRDDVTIDWNIAKADPEYTVPAGLTAEEGQTLADVKLPEGYAWADKTESVGSEGENTFKAIYTPEDTDNYNTAEVSVTVKVTKKAEDTKLKPGTYRITANLYLPGEKNTQLPGVTAYMTNPNNPIGEKPDNMPEGWNFEATAPTTPASDNATLVIKEDGTRVVILDVVNPVFTLQSITSGKNVSVLATERDSKTYADQSGVNKRNGRVTKLFAQLGDESGTYYFGDCIEFPTLLGENWNVSLELGVDFNSAVKTSDNTTVTLPDSDNKGDNNGDNNNGNKDDNNKKYDAPSIVSGGNSEWAYGSNTGLTFGISGNAGALLSVSVDGKQLGSSYYSVNGNNVTLNASYLNTITMGKHTVTLEYQGGSASASFTTVEGTKEVEVTKLKPGTYTVTANIWFEKADSGLPMNPHLTNSSFPPKDPVTDNATLKVDNDGRALVTVPIVIQSKVMTIQKITGLNIVDSTRDGNGNLTSITVDLGILENFDNVITKICSVQLKMGDLAMSISGFSRDHTWKAHFQVNLSGVPTVKGTHTVGVGPNGEILGVKTGDYAPIQTTALLMLVSAICIAGVLIGKKRRRQWN